MSLYHLAIVFHILAEEGTEDDMHVLDEGIVIQIIQVDTDYIGEDDVIIFLFHAQSPA